ncbi:MAG: sugar transferase [Ruminococcaceae bacterium]|nr:sugar transferase [Oscillospiraceae bacterium]
MSDKNNPTRRKIGFYERYIKRPQDFILSLIAIVVLSPVLLILTVLGACFMRGNPFFTQQRPGRGGKVFRLIKFRTMDNRRDSNGELLPDEVRLNRYGRLLRSTSLDELPELLNILKGDMAIVGPRPLLVAYLPLYNAHQARRHEVRPGLTGYAQVNGRNAITWEDKFDKDVWYVDHITFAGDWKIIFQTALSVIRRDGISAEGEATMGVFTGTKSDGQ